MARTAKALPGKSNGGIGKGGIVTKHGGTTDRLPARMPL